MSSGLKLFFHKKKLWMILLVFTFFPGCFFMARDMMYLDRVEMQQVYSKEPRALVPGSWGEYIVKSGNIKTSKNVVGILETTGEHLIWENVNYVYTAEERSSYSDLFLSGEGKRNLYCSGMKQTAEIFEATSQKGGSSLIQYQYLCIDKMPSFPEAIVTQCQLTFPSDDKDLIAFSDSMQSGTCYGKALPDGRVIPLDVSIADLEQKNYSEVIFNTKAPLPESSEAQQKKVSGFQKWLSSVGSTMAIGATTGLFSFGGPLLGAAFGLETGVLMASAPSDYMADRQAKKTGKVLGGNKEQKTYVGEPEIIKTVLGELTISPVVIEADVDFKIDEKRGINRERDVHYATKYKMFFSEYAPALGGLYFESITYFDSIVLGSNKKDRPTSINYLSQLGMDYESKMGGIIDYDDTAMKSPIGKHNQH